jgi:hypothetical protein
MPRRFRTSRYVRKLYRPFSNSVAVPALFLLPAAFPAHRLMVATERIAHPLYLPHPPKHIGKPLADHHPHGPLARSVHNYGWHDRSL